MIYKTIREAAIAGTGATGKVYEIDARTPESFIATATKTEIDISSLMGSHDIRAALAAKGTEVYSGDKA